jgi:hypothetical protein
MPPLTAKEYYRQRARRAAAHAMVACELQVPLDHVSVLPERDATLYFVRDDGSDVAAETLATVDYAGHAATVVLRTTGNMRFASANAAGTQPDFARAARRLDENPAAIEDAKFRALEIVARRQPEIERLADIIADRGTLGYDELVWLLDSELMSAPLPRRVGTARAQDRLAA